MRSEGLRGESNGEVPLKHTGANNGFICRKIARPLREAPLLYWYGRGLLRQRPGYGVLRSSRQASAGGIMPVGKGNELRRHRELCVRSSWSNRSSSPRRRSFPTLLEGFA